jgi:DNA-binding transcriptional LysR family regulator
MAQHGIPKISSEELQSFLVVAQYQSFVAAAIGLNISQPTLTRLIQNLEKQLNVSLFKRKFSRELGIISLKERELSNYAAVFVSLIKTNLKLK